MKFETTFSADELRHFLLRSIHSRYKIDMYVSNYSLFSYFVISITFIVTAICFSEKKVLTIKPFRWLRVFQKEVLFSAWMNRRYIEQLWAVQRLPCLSTSPLCNMNTTLSYWGLYAYFVEIIIYFVARKPKYIYICVCSIKIKLETHIMGK